jgi:hypothetical protein
MMAASAALGVMAFMKAALGVRFLAGAAPSLPVPQLSSLERTSSRVPSSQLPCEFSV